MKKKDIEQLGLLYEYVVGRSTSQSRKNGITISTGGGGFKPPPPPDDYDGDPGDDEDDGDGDDDENPYENGVYDRNEKRGGRENDPYTPIPAGIFASEIPKGLYANYGNNKKYAAQAELHKGLGPGHARSLDERYEMPIKEFLSILRRIWGPEFNSEFKTGPDDEKYQEKVTAAIRRVEKLPSFYLAKFKPDFDKGIIYRVNYTGEYKE